MMLVVGVGFCKIIECCIITDYDFLNVGELITFYTNSRKISKQETQ